ncbi:hypothetical protein [Hymenobacter jeollabukensis]|uniref:Uncharacterized protein n=1 Tax=Hymenobacter jeollabukensis TaxID=2025313 RepID=A0A5R8WIN1_9BACT|nr:hypothetical protein [Hymenobacter jeollabukensis]TLM88739.1 hypothetical protein FDY95_23180 [Hymenobacter jeollabukensis]
MEPTQDAPETAPGTGAAGTPPYPPIDEASMTKLLSNPNYTEKDREVLQRMGRGEISRDEAAALITQNVKEDNERRRNNA